MVIYPNLPLATSSVLHSDGLRVLKPPNNVTMDRYNSYNDEILLNQVGEGTDSDTILNKASSEPHFITRADLNVLVRDLNLSKSQDEILALRLKGWTFLQQDTKLCYFLNRQDELKMSFNHKNSQYCVMILVLLWRSLDINTIEDGGDSSSTS